jgi:uncharacterized protein (DUF1330 family)
VIRWLVEIDLSQADLAAFEAYERALLALMPDHGGKLLLRVRGVERAVETHLLAFPSQAAFDAYLADPRRQALSAAWRACGATATRWEVTEIA